MIKSKKGFTLIEMLVVIAVIGLLASMVLLGLGGARPAARDARRISDLRQLQAVLELFNQGYGRYPNAVTEWTTTSLGVKQLPTDPTRLGGIGGTGYAYAIDASAQNYVVKAWLERPNTAARPFDTTGYTAVGSTITSAPSGCAVAAADATYCVTKP